MPAFTLPTDYGLKLVQAHNQAELDIVSLAGRDSSGAARREGCARPLREVQQQLRKLNARARKTAQRLAAIARTPARRGGAGVHPRGEQSARQRRWRRSRVRSSAVDAGSQLHMIGTYGRGEKDALDEYTALKKKVDAQVRLISERYDAAHNLFKKAVDKLNADPAHDRGRRSSASPNR